MKVRFLVCALLALPPAAALASMDSMELVRHLDSVGLSADDASQARLRLGEDPLAPSQPRPREGRPRVKAAVELKVLADSFGRGQTDVPAVEGVCVDKTGKRIPCAASGDEGRLYDPKISGDCGCHELVLLAAEDLRAEVFTRGRGSGRTGSEYFDRFFVYLIEQFTETGKGEKLPRVLEGTPEVAGDVGSYLPGSGTVTVGPEFCALPRALRRKLLGHGYFHRWDDGLDGTPLPGKEEAERNAFAVMEFL